MALADLSVTYPRRVNCTTIINMLSPPNSVLRRSQVAHKPDHVMATIIIIDDRQETNELYEAILQPMGYEVIAVQNAVHGIELVRQHRPQLIIMDILLPTMSGWEAIEVLKADEALKAIPILAISAANTQESDEKALSYPIEAFMRKPFTPSELMRMVKHILG